MCIHTKRGKNKMAYGRYKKYGRYSKSKLASRAAHRVSRKAYYGALKMSKRKLAKVYATKCGQTTWRAVRKLGKRAWKWGKNRRTIRRYKRVRPISYSRRYRRFIRR